MGEAPLTTIVRLTDTGWFRRTWTVQFEGQTHRVHYNGWGLGSESVSVNNEVVVTRRGLGLMSHGYRFILGHDRCVSLRVAVPWWCEMFPICDLSFVRLEISGLLKYEEGHEPRKPVKWTSAVSGFPVFLGDSNGER